MTERLRNQSKTMDQRRAEDALCKIKRIEQNLCEDDQDRYANYVERLPAAILTNGLGQAAAQLLAAANRVGTTQRKRDPHYLLYQDLSEWLCRDEKEAPYSEYGDLLKGITQEGRSKYMIAQAEALAWLEWHKKLAVAYLKRPEGEA